MVQALDKPTPPRPTVGVHLEVAAHPHSPSAQRQIIKMIKAAQPALRFLQRHQKYIARLNGFSANQRSIASSADLALRSGLVRGHTWQPDCLSFSGTPHTRTSLSPTRVADSAQLPPVLLETWSALDGGSLSGKELALKLGLSVHSGGLASVRKRVQRLRESGFLVKTCPGGGYFRPDAPPPSGPSDMV